MRFLLLSVLLAACSTDTFTGDDGGGGDASTDGPTSGDGFSSEGGKFDGAPAFDPSALGASLVLWMDAEDAKLADAGNIVATWPDHQKRYTTATSAGASTATCTIPGLRTMMDGKINHAVVTFCNANLEVTDAPSLRMGTSPFFISAVISPASSNGNDDVLFTKTPPGDNNTDPSHLTLLAPMSAGLMEGWLASGGGTALTQNSLQQDFQYVTFVRTTTQITIRVDGQGNNPAMVNSSDDVSNSGANIDIGGYRFDLGVIRDVFGGELAELLVVTDPNRIGDVETYFRKKYNLN